MAVTAFPPASPGAPGTREVLILTAERLFAEQGIDRVSLRQIGEAAGRRQPSAVQYHFGDAHGLCRAIVEFRTRAATERRTVMLDDLVLAGRHDDVHALLEAVVFPLLETLPPDSHYLGFVAELLARKRLVPIFAEPGTEYGENAQRIGRYLDDALIGSFGRPRGAAPAPHRACPRHGAHVARRTTGSRPTVAAAPAACPPISWSPTCSGPRPPCSRLPCRPSARAPATPATSRRRSR